MRVDWKSKTPRGVTWTFVPRDNGSVGAKWWNPDKGERGGYQWITTFHDTEAAQAAERDWNFGVGKRRWTVNEWADFWLQRYMNRRAPGTVLNYRQAVKRIKADVGTRDMDTIDRMEGRVLSNVWPRYVLRTARTMWSDAIHDGADLRLNPFTQLRLETPPGRKDIDALTEEECASLVSIADECLGDYGFEFGTMLAVLGSCGVRPGEVYALWHDDLRLDRLEMHVRRAIDATRQLRPTKNKKERTISVPPMAAARVAQMPRRLIEVDGRTAADPYVFRTPRGRRFNKSSFYYWWRPVHEVWKANGGRELDPYELRHAAATHFVERGVSSADVAEQLGQQDGGRLVEQVYGHPSKRASLERRKMAYAQRTQAERKSRGYAG